MQGQQCLRIDHKLGCNAEGVAILVLHPLSTVFLSPRINGDDARRLEQARLSCADGVQEVRGWQSVQYPKVLVTHVVGATSQAECQDAVTNRDVAR